jgi:hypothetical protein
MRLAKGARRRHSELSSSDPAVRERGVRDSASRGTLRGTDRPPHAADEHGRTGPDAEPRLLLTDFVTELRTTFTDATTGEKASTDAGLHSGAAGQPASRSRLTAEAKQEGEAALARLQQMRQPTMNDHQSRHMFRRLARAHEGAGHDAEALRWYGQFVEFGSQFQQPKMCAGCHTTMGPRDWSFFKDWYAGRKFGEYA